MPSKDAQHINGDQRSSQPQNGGSSPVGSFQGTPVQGQNGSMIQGKGISGGIKSPQGIANTQQKQVSAEQKPRKQIITKKEKRERVLASKKSRRKLLVILISIILLAFFIATSYRLYSFFTDQYQHSLNIDQGEAQKNKIRMNIQGYEEVLKELDQLKSYSD